jgi:hypothetical protein
MFASLTSDVLLWLLVSGYATHLALSRMFGAEWPKQLGDYLRERWGRREAHHDGAKANSDDPG